jgi:hypothetical protein
MNWLKLKLRNWVLSAHDECERDSNIVSSKRGISVSTKDMNSDPTLNFKVYSAVGGKVVEFSRYDRRSDRNDHTTYIITNEQDFGERIAKIATMENLKA